MKHFVAYEHQRIALTGWLEQTGHSSAVTGNWGRESCRLEVPGGQEIHGQGVCRLVKPDAAADGGRSGCALVWRRQWAHMYTRMTCPQHLFTGGDITTWKDESWRASMRTHSGSWILTAQVGHAFRQQSFLEWPASLTGHWVCRL